MWLLVLICVSTVGSVPVGPSQGDTASVTGNATVNSVLHVPQPVPTGSLTAPLNNTHNVTSPMSGVNVTILPDPPQSANSETLEELEEDMTVQEGDILIPEDRNAVGNLWLGATVPYTISEELADRESQINTAFKMISQSTCIRFQKRTTELNYVKFRDGKGCASYVGCQGGAQSVFYSHSCSVGNLCHEIIHALGLHHEHTRKDRDKYITVQWKNIKPGRERNFKMTHGNTHNLPYDLNSIMHYGEYFFSQQGNPTIVPKYKAQIGQRTHLSKLDIKKLNSLYKCDEKKKLYKELGLLLDYLNLP